MVWYRVIIVSALSPSLRDKDRLRDRESLTIFILRSMNLCKQNLLLMFNYFLQNQ